MKVAVGSENPTKIQAVKLAFQTVWPGKKWEIIGVNVPSGVSDQPMSDLESIKGATNRAKKALKALGADFGVGLEGGAQRIGSNWLECGVMVVIDKEGKIGIGSSPRIMLSKKVLKMIKKGMELGVVADKLFNRTNVKQAEGFFGLMTKNTITRTSGYRDGVIMALTRFIHPEVFEDSV